MNPFVGYENIVMLLAPVDIVSTATTTPYMSLKNAQEAAFLVSYGLITSDTADTEVITVQCATAEGGAEATIAFSYRLSGAVGANTWGAVTTCASTGLSLAHASDDNKMVWIELPLDELAASDYTVARLVLTDTTDLAACLVAVHGIIRPRYRQSTHLSATASASA